MKKDRVCLCTSFPCECPEAMLDRLTGGQRFLLGMGIGALIGIAVKLGVVLTDWLASVL